MIYIPIIGAVALGAGTILQKMVLKKKSVNIKAYQVAEFLAITLVMLPFIYFFWKVDTAALELKNIIIFLSVVLFSIIANLFVFYSMKWEKVSNLEPAKILEPLFVILLAIVFSFIFGEELFDRNLNVLVPALIAGGALIFSHVKKHHLSFNKYFLAAIAGSFFFAPELIVTRLILNFYSPITFYFLRCSAVLLVSFILFRPSFSKFTKKTKIQIVILGIIWFIFRVVIYYGYLNYGVIFTTLIIMLGPILIYFFAHIFLKEKVGWKNVVASIIIVGAVLYASIN